MNDRNIRNTQSLQAYAYGLKQGVENRLRHAMIAIEKEIEASGGIYPHGKLTQRELCSRADVRQSTLQKDTHKGTTLVEVNAWLTRVAAAMRTSTSVRKNVATAVTDLKRRNDELKQRYHETELELIDANVRIARLEAQVAALMSDKQNNVTSIVTRKRPSSQA